MRPRNASSVIGSTGTRLALIADMNRLSAWGAKSWLAQQRRNTVHDVTQLEAPRFSASPPTISLRTTVNWSQTTFPDRGSIPVLTGGCRHDILMFKKKRSAAAREFIRRFRGPPRNRAQNCAEFNQK